MREPHSVGYSRLAIVSLLVVVVAIATYAAPLVTITKPADKSIVSGTAQIEVTYTSDSGSPIVLLQVFIDGRLVKDFPLPSGALQGKQSFRWDFTLATPSTHSISARAVDAQGVAGTTGIKVVVRRRDRQSPLPREADRTPPTIDIYYPAEGQVVSGEIVVKADVSDNVGVRTVVFYLDGKFKTMMMNSPNYSDHIDTRKLSDGPHVVSASAWDAAENEGRSEERTFIVRNRQATGQSPAESRVSRSALPKPPPPVLEVPSTPPVEPSKNVSMSETVSASSPDEGAPGVSHPRTDVGSAAAPMKPSVSPGEAKAPILTEVMTARGTPIVSDPTKVSLPPPPSRKAATTASKPEVKPATSGLVASLPPQVADQAARVSTPSTSTSAPIASVAGKLPAKPRPPATDESLDQVALLMGSRQAAAGAVPTDVVSVPKTAPGGKMVVLASPQHPRIAYVSAPVGSLRQARVAALPPRKMEECPRGKTCLPRSFDVRAMARFRDVKIVFNGELLSLRAAPMVLDGISITPLREIFEHTDGVLYWFHVEKRVRAVNPDTELELQIGDPVVKVNGDEENLVLAPFIKNGRTMVPLEFIARTLDVTVSFNSDTGELIISSNKF